MRRPGRVHTSVLGHAGRQRGREAVMDPSGHVPGHVPGCVAPTGGRVLSPTHKLAPVVEPTPERPNA
eukprot:scaffold26707_cov45-Isochrysis_galbana.AAC.1